MTYHFDIIEGAIRMFQDCLTPTPLDIMDDMLEKNPDLSYLIETFNLEMS